MVILSKKYMITDVKLMFLASIIDIGFLLTLSCFHMITDQFHLVHDIFTYIRIQQLMVTNLEPSYRGSTF